MKWNKLSSLIISSTILFGGFATVTYADSSVSVEEESVEVNTISDDSAVLNELITKIKELFPEKFGQADNRNFELDFRPPYPGEEDIERIYVHYFERQSTNPSSASFQFTGENYELTSFHYYNQDRSDALFPPKVSEQEALQIAKDFLKKMNISFEYQLREDRIFRNHINTPLTEPIEYSFIFDRLENGIPVQNQSVSITVLGNGEVVDFNRAIQIEEAEFENTDGIKPKDELLEKIREDLHVELQYLIHRDYSSQKTEAYLVYGEVPTIQGVSAKDGKYYINGEYVEELPKETDIKMLATNSKQPKGITKDEAREIAIQLLEIDDENVTLRIDGVHEREDSEGTIYYEVVYMYFTGSSGHGSSIQIKKDSGELLHYSDLWGNPNETVDVNVSKEEALKLAVEYIEKYAYTQMDKYAYPINSTDVNSSNNSFYQFTFPRVKDGLIVNGDYIVVGVSKENGSLMMLYNNYSDIDQWPSVNDAVSKALALEEIKDQIDLKLYYVDEKLENQALLYMLRYNRDDVTTRSFFDAVTGEWKSFSPYLEEQNDVTISHSWAEEELNFMIRNNIIEVKDPDNFDGDEYVTKGEALEILSKSLVRIYDRPYIDEREESPFSNIDKDHELYEVIVRSVELGILDKNQENFDIDAELTRENLAFWYVRVLGLNAVAKDHDLFNYDKFTDQKNMSEEYRGYVAIADSLGILTKNHVGHFLPKNKVNYAQLSVSALRLAKLITSEEFK